jgi:hypothetical protein
LKKRVEVEAAENACVLIRAADSRGQVLLDHSVRHRDEMRGDAAGAALGGSKNAVCKRPLPRSEGWAVQAVNNDGHLLKVRGIAAQYARFAAVRMNNRGLGFAEMAEELRKSFQISEGANGPSERRDDGEETGLVPK